MKCFGTVRQKLRRKMVILPPPLIYKLFCYRKYLKHSTEGFPCEIFWQCKTKIFRRKILILLPPPPPSYPIFFSIPEINETLKDPPPPTEIVGTVRQKISDRKSWNSSPLPPPPLLSNFFSMPEINETLKDSPPTKFFGTETKKFRQKILKLTPPPPLIHKLFRYRKFLKHSTEGFPCEIFRQCKTKNFDGKSWYSPPPLSKFFRCPKLMKH